MFEVILFFLIFALIVSYYTWQKEKDNFQLYLAWLYGIGILVSIWTEFGGSISRVPRTIILVFWIAMAAVWGFLNIKSQMASRKMTRKEIESYVDRFVNEASSQLQKLTQYFGHG